MMGWIVLTVLAGILVICGVVAFAVLKSSRRAYVEAGRDPSSLAAPGWALGGIVAVVGLWFLITMFMMVKTVGEREIGIVYNFTGTIAGKKEKGWVTIAPWQRMEKANVAIQHADYAFTKDNSAVSKDQQDIFANLAVNYQLNSETVLDLYRRVGPNWKEIIVQARVPQVFKEVTSTMNTPEITEKREQLRAETREKIAAELRPYDIEIVDVFITNLGFSKLYSQAIEEKQKQVQDALRAEARVRQVKAEADQKFEEASGEARANVAKARGEAQANRLRRQSLTPALIQWEAIQKLNPKVQMIICPPASVCIPNSAVVPAPQAP
jgi:regulator of protease activity HflC (stomatin/prohibitin superfamily)